MWNHNKEAIAAVEEFNEKVLDTIGNDREFSMDHVMSMETDGTCTIIKFMGVTLWSSEDDMRQHADNDESEYEPLLGFLEKRAKEELERFSRVLLPKIEEET